MQRILLSYTELYLPIDENESEVGAPMGGQQPTAEYGQGEGL